jgi:2'-5' RNA ligase
MAALIGGARPDLSRRTVRSMRCFVAAWPTGSMLDVLHAVDRPDIAGLRWTTPDQWHVTLRFLGEVADAEAPALTAALRDGLADVAASLATAGPATTELGGQLVIPVAGVDDLAAAVVAATGPFGDAPERRRFRGHFTLARTKRGSVIPRDLLGRPIAGEWTVDAVALVRSHLEPTGARYEDLARVDLTVAGRG